MNVAIGRLEMTREEGDSEHLQAIDRALSRMETLITDVLALAQEGESVAEMEVVSLTETAIRAWEVIDTRDATLVTEEDIEFEADVDWDRCWRIYFGMPLITVTPE